jgi:hypothetical protein
VVDPVAIRPARSVTIDRAESRVIGSKDVAVPLRRKAAIGMFNTGKVP